MQNEKEKLRTWRIREKNWENVEWQKNEKLINEREILRNSESVARNW